MTTLALGRIRDNIPFTGILWAILVSIVGGLIIGGVLALVSQLVYVIVLFPILMIWAGGLLLEWAIKTGEIHNRVWVLLLGLLISAYIYGGFQYADYQINWARDSAPIQDPITDQMNPATPPYTDFPSFMTYKAQTGSILRLVVDIIDLVGDGSFMWAYWLIALIGVIVAIEYKAIRTIRAPYCQKHHHFFVTKTIGKVEEHDADKFVDAAKVYNWQLAHTFITDRHHRIKYPFLDVRVEKCPVCNTNPLPLFVTREFSSSKEDKQLVIKAWINPPSYDTLLQGTPKPVI